MTCRVDLMKNDTTGQWDAYVRQSPQATLFHGTPWKQVVESTYGCTGFYLYAYENNEIQGILPLFLCGSRLTGKSLVALPFVATQPSVCADNEAAEQALLEAACQLARKHGVTTVELREQAEKSWGWQARQTYVNVQLALDPNPETVWLSRMDGKVRTKVSRALERGLEISWGDRDHIDDFYRLYAHTMSRLGSPPHAKALFEHTIKAYPDQAQIALVMYGNQAIAGAFLMHNERWIGFPWAASLAGSHPLRPNNLLYWRIIELACRKGYAALDLGRSPVESGTLHFKMQWGGTARPLWYYYHVDSGKAPSIRDTSSPAMRAASWLWRRFPERFSTRLGSHLARLIP